MAKLLTTLLDTVFPPSPHQIIVRELSISTVSKLYEPGKCFGSVTFLCRYTNQTVQALIQENKFAGNKNASRLLACLLETWITSQNVPLVFVPIPLSRARQKKRGYNQVETILQHVKIPVHTKSDWLIRQKDTTPQSKLDKSKRKSNVTNAFVCCSKKLVVPPGAKVVLLDDVVTTGSTLKVARASLAPHLSPGTTLECLAMAH